MVVTVVMLDCQWRRAIGVGHAARRIGASLDVPDRRWMTAGKLSGNETSVAYPRARHPAGRPARPAERRRDWRGCRRCSSSRGWHRTSSRRSLGAGSRSDCRCCSSLRTRFRWHDLRHTWATWQRQAGTPTHELQHLGGWRTGAMVERYAHLAPDHLSSAAGRMDGVMAGYNPVAATAKRKRPASLRAA